MKRQQVALLVAQMLLYGLMITFIFADLTFNLTDILRPEGAGLSAQMAFVGACLVGLTGAINLWLTWYYIQKSNTMRDWLVVCAWTHRVKCAGRWMSLEEFFVEHLGFNVSHGLSTVEAALMRDELDAKWQQMHADLTSNPRERGTDRAGVAPEGSPAG